jgi:carboxymethylenebutenolidase
MFEAIVELARVIAVILLIGMLLAVGALVGVVAADAAFGPKAADFSNITYPNPAGGGDLYAYLNIPQAEGPYPGVIMLPYQWGLNTEMTRLANFLSERGYITIVPDLYRGTATETLPRALLLTRLTPDDQLFADIQASFNYLTTLDEIDPTRIGIVGFGYGGGVALRYATRNPRLAATVDISGEVITSAEMLNGFEAGPVMGIFGANDTAIPPTQIGQFGAALEAAGIEHEIKTYEKVGSDFIKLPDLSIFNSTAYVAWTDMIHFLDEALKS